VQRLSRGARKDLQEWVGYDCTCWGILGERAVLVEVSILLHSGELGGGVLLLRLLQERVIHDLGETRFCAVCDKVFLKEGVVEVVVIFVPDIDQTGGNGKQKVNARNRTG
jgi:hypothetical protein